MSGMPMQRELQRGAFGTGPERIRLFQKED